MHQPAIIVNGLKVKCGGQTVLDGISFTLLQGQHLAIVGASGSGKSTLAMAMAGQVHYEGTISFHTNGQPEKKRVTYVAQRHYFKNLSNVAQFYYQQRYNSTESADAATVEQVLVQAAEKIIADGNKRMEAINHWLAQLQLGYRRHTPLLQLSNGEHKRLQLVKALLSQPQILILDQPFTGLDVQSREELHAIINRLAAYTTIIITAGNEMPDSITHVATLYKRVLKSFVTRKNYTETEPAQNFVDNKQPLPVLKEPVMFNHAVALYNTTVKYGDKTVLKNISWQVARGEKWLVKGPNGAGKSTLLSLLTGDNPQAYANEIFLFDRRRGTGESIWDIKKKVGYISPELHQYFDKSITVYNAVASGFFDTMGLYRQLSAAQAQTLLQWLAYFKLTHLQHQPLSGLSNGLQRLVLLARALVKDPPLLILDEPCQGLDDSQAAAFTALIDEWCTTAQKTLIYVSHYEAEVPACVHKVLELKNGEATISHWRNGKTVAA